MRVFFRADASSEIGTGHVMRCLTLADCFVEQGAEVAFICRHLLPNLTDLIGSKGYTLNRLLSDGAGLTAGSHGSGHERWLGVDKETDSSETRALLVRIGAPADWLVIDHYALDAKWQQTVRPHVGGIMVVDDLADRAHDCDLLLDQNLHENMRERYGDLVPPRCTQLIGPRYALLRPEFRKWRERIRSRDGMINRILVFFGGTDVTNETVKVLNAVRSLDRSGIRCDVVIGGSNPNRSEIEQAARDVLDVELHYETRNMAQLMAAADLALGAAGTTTWERCCLGLPCLIVAVAPNQVSIGQESGKAGIAEYLGTSREVSCEYLAGKLTQYLNKPDRVRDMSRRSMALVDGQGASRVVSRLYVAGRQGIRR